MVRYQLWCLWGKRLSEPQCMSDQITRTSLHISATQMHKARKTEFCCWSKKSLCLLLNPVFPDARSLLVIYREDKIGPSSPRAYSTVSPASREWQHRHMHISSRPASLLHLVSPNACFFVPPDENLVILKLQAQVEIKLTHTNSLSHQRSCASPHCPLPSFPIPQRTVRPGDYPATFPSPGMPPKSSRRGGWEIW